MRQLLTILLLTLATVAKSQDTIKVPYPVAKTMAKELVACDSIKAIHELTKEELTLTQNKVILKDSIITNFKDKCTTYDLMLSNEKQKFEVQGEWVKDLRKDNKKLKARLTFTKLTLSAVIGFLSYLYITK